MSHNLVYQVPVANVVCGGLLAVFYLTQAGGYTDLDKNKLILATGCGHLPRTQRKRFQESIFRLLLVSGLAASVSFPICVRLHLSGGVANLIVFQS